MNLEDDLRRALRREDAPADFAAGVIEKTQAPALPFWKRPAVFAMAAGLAVAALIPPAIYQYGEERRAREARDQLMVALSITRVQLQQVEEKIRQNTRHNR